MIEDLREQLAQKDKRIAYLEEAQAELLDLKAKIGRNPQLYYQIMQPADAMSDRQEQLRREQQAQQRQARIDAEKVEEYDRQYKSVLAENPVWKQNADDAKVKIQQQRDTMMQKAKEFYLLTPEKLQQYINIQHKPEQSACKHLINEIQDVDSIGQHHFAYYECDFCKDKQYSTLADFERHCYYSGDTHHDINMSRIEKETQESIAKIYTELRKDVDEEIKDKAEREYKKREAKRRAEQSKLKSTLPYVTKQ